MKILFVCLGNICRSPIAEGILKMKVKERNLDWIIESAGTNRWNKGEHADHRTLSITERNGVDISAHIARRFRNSDFEDYDLIFCMAGEVKEELRDFVTDEKQWEKVKMLEVPDPYYGTEKEFEACFKYIDELCEDLVLKISNASL